MTDSDPDSRERGTGSWEYLKLIIDLLFVDPDRLRKFSESALEGAAKTSWRNFFRRLANICGILIVIGASLLAAALVLEPDSSFPGAEVFRTLDQSLQFSIILICMILIFRVLNDLSQGVNQGKPLLKIESHPYASGILEALFGFVILLFGWTAALNMRESIFEILIVAIFGSVLMAILILPISLVLSGAITFIESYTDNS